MKISIEKYDIGYLIANDQDGRRVLVQLDYEFPGLARTFGWSISAAIPGCRENHDQTDGSIACPACGTSAGVFISKASEFLEEGPDPIEDPGYFECESSAA
jgi:hypothetical protein